MEVAVVIPILLVREAEAYIVWKITEYHFEPKSYGLRSPVLTSMAYVSCSGLMLHLSQQEGLLAELEQQGRGTDAQIRTPMGSGQLLHGHGRAERYLSEGHKPA